MPKTPEQSKADDLLEAAVKAVVRAYGVTPPDAMIVDYLVIGEAIRYVENDEEECDIFLAWRNGHGRVTTTLGIIEMGKRHLFERLESQGNGD